MPTLHWIGKDKVINHHVEVPFKVLEHRYGFHGDNPDDQSETHSGNKIIHGDNLVALKALLPEYEGKIDCVYIDPPYNTGNEGWVYNDNVNDPHIRKWLGEVVGAEGEDLSRHDKWLCMMYPRLRLLQQLLSPRGAIFISIDDNECENLKLICDEIFGKSCFVANVSWQRTYSPRNDKDGIAAEVEHILVYGKFPTWSPQKLGRTKDMNSRYSNPDNDLKLWKNGDATAPGAINHQGMVYAIQHPITGKLLYPTHGRHWTFGQDQMFAIMKDWADYELKPIDDLERRKEICGTDDVPTTINAILLTNELNGKRQAEHRYKKGKWPILTFSSGGTGGFVRKVYLDNVEGRLVTNLWPFSEVGHTDEAKKELKEIFDGKSPFDTPKPTRLIERIIDIATDESSIVLDCFAGSGTTAHAVLKSNQKNHGNRKFILIELLDYADTMTAFRVKKAISGYKATMKHEVELYSKKLTIKNLKNSDEFIQEAYSIIEKEKGNYPEISDPKLVLNYIKVIASRVANKLVHGLGGSFDYYELGEPLFKDDGNLNENVGIDKIRAYIYYSETHQYLNREQDLKYPYLLDYLDGTGYFFYYEPNEITTLSHDTLTIVPKSADHYVIYADICAISKEELAQKNITFKKIPRDINRF